MGVVFGGQPPRTAALRLVAAPVRQAPPTASAAGRGCSSDAEREAPSDPLQPAQQGAEHAADLLAPAEHLLDPLADALAHSVARVPRSPSIDRRAPAIGVLRHVRCHAHVSHCPDEGPRVVGLVASQRAARGTIEPCHYRLAGVALGGAGRPRLCRSDRQAVPVLDHHMPGVAELRCLAVRLARQPRIRVHGRSMRLVAALLGMEVALAVAAGAERIAGAVLRPEAFYRSPGRYQRASHREVLRGQQRLDLRVGQHGGEELARHLGSQHPVPFLGEHRHVPYGRHARRSCAGTAQRPRAEPHGAAVPRLAQGGLRGDVFSGTVPGCPAVRCDTTLGRRAPIWSPLPAWTSPTRSCPPTGLAIPPRMWLAFMGGRVRVRSDAPYPRGCS